MLALWQDNWRTAPLLTSPRPLLLEAAGHRENFPSCSSLSFNTPTQKYVSFHKQQEILILQQLPVAR